MQISIAPVLNAHDVLKRLKLCGCVNITGLGLNPLRGSIVLEQIDIGLVGKHVKNQQMINPNQICLKRLLCPSSIVSFLRVVVH